VQGFTKSLAMTVLSEIGDKTFFAAAVRPPPPLTSPALPPVLLLVVPASALRAPMSLRRRARVHSPPGVRRYAAADAAARRASLLRCWRGEIIGSEDNWRCLDPVTRSCVR